MFRFHTGSIKRNEEIDITVPPAAAFRFHTGSIKRHTRRRGLQHNLCFDSILVRLKVDTATLIVEIAMFRFHTGSIKRSGCGIQEPSRKRFRFHTGSIKRLEAIYEGMYVYSFDSILVRLKESMSNYTETTEEFVSIPYWFD